MSRGRAVPGSTWFTGSEGGGRAWFGLGKHDYGHVPRGEKGIILEKYSLSVVFQSPLHESIAVLVWIKQTHGVKSQLCLLLHEKLPWFHIKDLRNFILFLETTDLLRSSRSYICGSPLGFCFSCFCPSRSLFIAALLLRTPRFSWRHCRVLVVVLWDLINVPVLMNCWKYATQVITKLHSFF